MRQCVSYSVWPAPWMRASLAANNTANSTAARDQIAATVPTGTAQNLGHRVAAVLASAALKLPALLLPIEKAPDPAMICDWSMQVSCRLSVREVGFGLYLARELA